MLKNKLHHAKMAAAPDAESYLATSPRALSTGQDAEHSVRGFACKPIFLAGQNATSYAFARVLSSGRARKVRSMSLNLQPQ